MLSDIYLNENMNSTVPTSSVDSSTSIIFMNAFTMLTTIAVLAFQVTKQLKKSKCCGGEFEFRSSNSLKNSQSPV